MGLWCHFGFVLGGLVELAVERKLNGNNRVSAIVSIIVHAFVFGLIKFANLGTSAVVETVLETYVDLGYQQFDEEPEVVSSPQTQTKVDNIVPDKSDPSPAQSQEMQDQNSDVAGLQKETKPVVTAQSNKPTTTVPYYKVKPKYPRDALESNLEGFVMMKIDILEDGSVENIKVTGGDKVDVFESAATRAVAKWKYKSFTDDSGNPLKKKDYVVRVDFKIKDEEQGIQ